MTKSYKKANPSLPKKVNIEVKKIAKEFNVDDKLNIMAKQQCFVTIKDHKPDFRTKPKYRLLNLTKSELGKLSKDILQTINTELRNKIKVNQWQNSNEVIKWFNNIPNKNECTFTVFDIPEFYPSITEDLLKQAILFAQNSVSIPPKNIDVIFRKSLLYPNDDPWVKKDTSVEFDITMGSYDGAEMCEIVGLFMLDMLSKLFEKVSSGLYRDDGLSIFRNYNGHQNDKVRKDLIKLFKKYQLNLDKKCNLKIVDYLDISFDWNTGIYKPFNKPNKKPLYINASSNHPPSVLKQIPKSVSTRITANSCNEDIFRKSAPFYDAILQGCGFNENIKYCPEESVSSRRRKNRSRNIIWYNPPFSKNVKTNVRKHFFKLLKKHFGKNHKYQKIFNKNNIKL